MRVGRGKVRVREISVSANFGSLRISRYGSFIPLDPLLDSLSQRLKMPDGQTNRRKTQTDKRVHGLRNAIRCEGIRKRI